MRGAVCVCGVVPLLATEDDDGKKTKLLAQISSSQLIGWKISKTKGF